MQSKLLAILSLMLCSMVTMGYAQTSQQATDDSKVHDNSVWYNARRGEPTAMNQVGIWYYSGNKVARDYAQAYYWWSQAALKQNAKAIANLGICYQYGRGVQRDSVAAIQLYLTAIQNGQQELLTQRLGNTPHNAFDDMLTALCYEKGIGTLRNTEKAAQLYAAAADQGSVEGMVAAATMLLETGKALDALKYYEKAAAKGNTKAAYMVGKMRLGGMGVSADKPKAVDYLKRAAHAGLPEAQTAYGTLFFTGEAVGRDINQALKWLRQGAEGGDAEGMWQYGMALKQNKDYEPALFWLSMAAQAGYQKQFCDMYDHLQASDAFRLYIAGMRRYAVNGSMTTSIDDFDAMDKGKSNIGKVMHGIVLADPKNRKNDTAKAAKILEKISGECPQAAYCLACLYMDARGVPHDTGKALQLYRRAADAGYGYAQSALGDIYFEGKITGADKKAAADMYKKAYQQHQLSSQGAARLRAMIMAQDPVLASQLAAYSADDPVVPTLRALSR